MPVFLRHKVRSNGEFTEELWDSGGNPRKNGHYDGGGYFRTYRHGITYADSQRANIGEYGGISYPDAFMRANIPDRYQFDNTWNGPYEDFSNYNASDYGAEAWNRMRPDRPNMSGLNAIHELRDVPRSLEQRVLHHRDLPGWASYHVAVQFGWLPLFHDVQDTVSTAFSLNQRLGQLLRDEGKPVRRAISVRNTLKKDYGGYTTSYAAFNSGMVTQAFHNVPNFYDVMENGHHVWSAAKFRYYLPKGPRNWRWRIGMKSKIFGLDPSPSTVWNAVPWSWLADWFSNASDVIENIDFTVADRLYAEYAYVMQTKRTTCTRYSQGEMNLSAGGSSTFSCSTSLVEETKERTIIDPFGPAVDFSSMSGRQAAILGAIGLSGMPSAAGRY